MRLFKITLRCCICNTREEPAWVHWGLQGRENGDRVGILKEDERGLCHAQLLQLCLTLCSPMDCSLPDSSVHGILEKRMLEWVAISFSRGSSQPRDQTHISCLLHWQVDSFPLNHLGSSWAGLRIPFQFSSVQFCHSVMSDSLQPPWNAAFQACLSVTNSRSLLKLMSIQLVTPSNHLILCHPLLLLPSIFPSIRVFSRESGLCIRWPKYWSFSFSISPSNEYSGLISFRMDWLDLLVVQGTLKSLLQYHSSKASIWGTLCPPSDVYVRSFLCPFLYFNKTLLHKSSWVIKPGPLSWS